MSDAFQRKLETNVNRLIESYKTLLKKSDVNAAHAPQEGLVITAAAATIVSELIMHPYPSELHNFLTLLLMMQAYHAQSLLDQIETVRTRIILEGSID